MLRGLRGLGFWAASNNYYKVEDLLIKLLGETKSLTT